MNPIWSLYLHRQNAFHCFVSRLVMSFLCQLICRRWMTGAEFFVYATGFMSLHANVTPNTETFVRSSWPSSCLLWVSSWSADAARTSWSTFAWPSWVGFLVSSTRCTCYVRSESLRFSIINHLTVTSSSNTRECLALFAASCDSVRRNHDITDRISQAIYSLPSNTSLIWCSEWEWCCQWGSEKIRPRPWQPNMRPPLTSKPDLNGGGIFSFPLLVYDLAQICFMS